MRVPKFRLAALAFVSSIALGGCAYDMYGDDYGYGYGPYGGLGVGIGYGSGYYGGYGYGPYGYGYGPYGYGYDPFGWYGGYYYPGSGIYVYDRDRHRREMTDDERRHWREVMGRLHNGSTTATTTSVAPRENWSGFYRGRQRGSDSAGASPNWNRGRWSRETTTSSTSTTDTTRSNNGWHARGHRHDD